MHLMLSREKKNMHIYSTHLKRPRALTRDYCTCQHFAFNTSHVRHAEYCAFFVHFTFRNGFYVSAVNICCQNPEMQLRIYGPHKNAFQVSLCAKFVFFSLFLFIYYVLSLTVSIPDIEVTKLALNEMHQLKNIKKKVWPFNATLFLVCLKMDAHLA